VAIVFPDYIMMMRLKARGHLKPGFTMMEIGKQNWAGDVPIDKLIADTADKRTTTKLRQTLKRDPNSFKITDHYYRNVLGCSDYESIDPGVADSDYKFDLNYSLPEILSYDVVTDSGTGEHIFNQAQLFRTMHDLTKKGGIMTHVLPWTGWYNHGFYNFQPTLVYDLAAANDYTVLDFVLGGVGIPVVFDMVPPERWRCMIAEMMVCKDAFVFDNMEVRLHHSVWGVALRKNSSKQFKIPNQGAYADDVKKPVKRVRITVQSGESR
jgi:hypothetical protein